MATTQGALRPLERNRFYYGKLMDVRQWTLEQSYGIEARHLISRLGLGSGVLGGLGVSIDATGCLRIDPGVAIDSMGREIIVPLGVALPHPEQPTDCLGRPDGDPVAAGSVTIAVCYRECLAEPTAAVSCGCDTGDRCEHGVVQEGYCIRVDSVPPPDADPFPCSTTFPAAPPDGFDRRQTIFDALAGPCPPAADDCVVLATVTFAPNTDPVVDPFTHRRVIYSNQTLFEMLLCLADRVDACCGHGTPVTNPPRVMRVWPRDAEVIAQAAPDEAKSFVKLPRVEVTFERSMDPAALADPDPWLRAWSVRRTADGVLARRIALRHDDPPTMPPILAPLAGEAVATYAFDDRYKEELKDARVLIQLRPDVGGRVVVDTSTPPLLLDGEHHGTDLVEQELEDFWVNVVDPTAPVPLTPPSIWDALFGQAVPPFPSGNGTEGGALDLGFAFADKPVAAQPKLLAVWPPNASYLRPSGGQDEHAWWASFREQPRLELTFEDTVNVSALGGALDAWLELWWLVEEGPDLVPKPVALTFEGPVQQPTLPAPAKSVTVAVKANVPFATFVANKPNHLLVVIRGDHASVDANYDGIAQLAAADVADAVEQGNWPPGVPVGGPPSIGQPMADGQPGGTAATYFDYAADA